MTVSNAYNRPDQLSVELRERILETAQRLGFPGPDPLARGLRRGGRSGAIGLVYDSRLTYAVRDPAAVGFLGGVCDAAEAAELGLLLVPGSAPEQRDAAAIGAALIDGVIVYSVADGDPLVAAVLQRRIPTVIVDQPPTPDVPLVGIDDHAAAREAAEHLLALGHRRVAVISFALAPDGHRGLADRDRQRRARYPVTNTRLGGYAAALGDAGCAWADVPVYECPGSSVPLGRGAAAALLETRPRPTAILTTSDALALGVVEAARERGIVVPDELSVVGFDDVPAGRSLSPPLTTVHQDHADKGRLAAELLLAELHGKAPPDPRLTIPHRLEVRDTTAPPRRGG